MQHSSPIVCKILKAEFSSKNHTAHLPKFNFEMRSHDLCVYVCVFDDCTSLKFTKHCIEIHYGEKKTKAIALKISVEVNKQHFTGDNEFNSFWTEKFFMTEQRFRIANEVWFWVSNYTGLGNGHRLSSTLYYMKEKFRWKAYLVSTFNSICLFQWAFVLKLILVDAIVCCWTFFSFPIATTSLQISDKKGLCKQHQQQAE